MICLDDSRSSAPEGERRLAAIMFTDLVGFTTLTQNSEPLALKIVEKQNRLLRRIFPRHHGREIKSMGDSFLVEFDSSLDAVKCGIEIQQLLHDRNAALTEDQRINVRIGIHLGDVVHKAKDVLGDAVNIASRIQPLADAGGLCISEQVFDQVRNKVRNRFVRLENTHLRGVRFPLEVYKIVLPWESAATSAEELEEPHEAKKKGAGVGRLDKRRIAVMPFVNMSPDKSDEYLADGLTEEVISKVSTIRTLSVISRTSAMRYKGAMKTAAQIGEELNVGSLLEGSVRRSETRLRMMVHLIDVKTDTDSWSHTYERELSNLFEVQEDIAKSVAEALEVKLLAPELKSLARAATRNAEAHLLYLKGLHFFNQRTLVLGEGQRKVIPFYEKAVETDPSFALAYSGLANCYLELMENGTFSTSQGLGPSRKYALAAVKLDDTLADAHVALGSVLSHEWEWTLAEKEFKRALELNRKDPYAHSRYGELLMQLGRFDECIEEEKKAIEVDPVAARRYFDLGKVYFYARMYDDCLEEFQRVLMIDPDYLSAHFWIGISYMEKSMLSNAMEEFDKSPRGAYMSMITGVWYSRSGKIDDAHRVLNELKQQEKRGFVPPYAMAIMNLELGEKELALEYLEKAYGDKDGRIGFLKVSPYFEGLKSEPRYQTLLEKMGLVNSN